MTTAKQDQSFIESVINPYLLEAAIEWIAKNMSPDDVFSEDDLDDWAVRTGYYDTRV